MKTSYLFLSFCCVFFLIPMHAQDPDPELFQHHWELVYTQFDEMAPFDFYVPDIEPPITPFLEISEDFTFRGQGACNTFTGTMGFLNDVEMRSVDFEATGEDCEHAVHIAFEEDYFSFFTTQMPFEYLVNRVNGERFLHFGYVLGGSALFAARPLAVADFEKTDVVVFPNPVTDVLVLEFSEYYPQLLVRLFSADGRLLENKTIVSAQRAEIDVAALAAGIYFVRIEQQGKTLGTKRFIKQ